MIITLIIFCTVVTGHRRHGGYEESRPGSGGKALIYFEVGFPRWALIIGLCVGNFVQPGAGF